MIRTCIHTSGEAQNTVNRVLLGTEQNWGLYLGIKCLAQGYVSCAKVANGEENIYPQLDFPSQSGIYFMHAKCREKWELKFTHQECETMASLSPEGELFEYQYRIPSVQNVLSQPQ